ADADPVHQIVVDRDADHGAAHLGKFRFLADAKQQRVRRRLDAQRQQIGDVRRYGRIHPFTTLESLYKSLDSDIARNSPPLMAAQAISNHGKEAVSPRPDDPAVLLLPPGAQDLATCRLPFHGAGSRPGTSDAAALTS